jgi:hypothetical protein
MTYLLVARFAFWAARAGRAAGFVYLDRRTRD